MQVYRMTRHTSIGTETEADQTRVPGSQTSSASNNRPPLTDHLDSPTMSASDTDTFNTPALCHHPTCQHCVVITCASTVSSHITVSLAAEMHSGQCWQATSAACLLMSLDQWAQSHRQVCHLKTTRLIVQQMTQFTVL